MRTQLSRLALVVLLAACRPPAASPTAPLGPTEIVIAHTNDLHAHFRPSAAPWLPGSPEIGGFRAIDAWIDALERVHGKDRVLYFDAGDLLTGTPLMEYRVRGSDGGAMLDFLEATGCDAWALGNHELDRGWENTAALVSSSRVPVLSANVRAAGDPGAPGFPGLRPSIILQVEDLRIGVFGLTTEKLEGLASPETMARLDLRSAIESAREQVEILEPDVDLVVALTHNGVEEDRRLAAAVEGIDLIVGGHSHSSLTEPEEVAGTLIVQAGSHARQLGLLRGRLDDGRIKDVSYTLVDLDPIALPGPASPDVIALVDQWSARIDDKYRSPIGEAPVALSRRDQNGETELGRWASDVVRIAAKADVGIYNGGGIRADLPAGVLNLNHLYEVFPFDNEVVVFEARGDEIVGLLIENVMQRNKGWGGILVYSGLQWGWTRRMDVPELVDVRVGGEPLDPSRTYTVATNSYVAEQWAKFLNFEPRNLKGVGTTVRMAAEELVRTGPVLTPTQARGSRIP